MIGKVKVTTVNGWTCRNCGVWHPDEPTARERRLVRAAREWEAARIAFDMVSHPPALALVVRVEAWRRLQASESSLRSALAAYPELEGRAT